MKNVGGEITIRAKRGEKPTDLPIPENIPEDDDSEDFVLGMPNQDSGEAEEGDSDAKATPDNEILSGLTDLGSADDLDIDSLLGTDEASPAESDPSIPDLSEFLTDDANAAQDTASQSAPKTENSSPAEAPLEDLDLDSLLAPSGPSNDLDLDALSEFEDSPITENPAPTEDSAPTENPAAPGPAGSTDGLDSLGDLGSFDLPDFDNLTEESPVEEESFQPQAEEAAPEASPIPHAENAVQADPVAQADSDFAFDGQEINMNEDIPEEIAAEDGNPPETGGTEAPISEDIPAPAEEAAPEKSADEALPSFDDNIFDTSGLDFDTMPPPEGDAPNADSAAEIPSMDEAGDSPADLTPPPADDIQQEEAPAESPVAEEPPAPADDMSNLFDTAGLDFDSMPPPEGDVPDASADVPEMSSPDADVFDISAMDEFTEDDAKPSAPAAPDDEFPLTGGGGDDFVLDDNFEIPGFSDTDTASMEKKKPVVDTPNFAQAQASDKPKNTLTESEYAQFKKNLAEYPLNLRIAIEDLIVKNEFTDDAVFEVIEKVLKKTPARQVASHLEKMLDIAIPVPRDFERRSVAEYEAYKKSFQYQLRNRILPAAVAGVILCIFGFILFQAGVQFVYKPVMANILYKQGYTLLENNEYPGSESKFEEAVSYKPVKKWFFKYARGYRTHRQYERAGQMYYNILGVFNHDKKAGLEYAEMELYDLANYAKAEEIVRRQVLDWHINDSDGILLLGDIYLEWAETDPEKYELALAQYSLLTQLYGSKDLYLGRMLRYYIRTDQLKEVLGLKPHFYPNNKKALGAQDWTELSGYLLDKSYGNLSSSEEYLRSAIEDVRGMLETAVKADPSNPTAHYNFARYFVHTTGSVNLAKSEFNTALDLYDAAPVRTKKNIYRQIDAARMLGELWTEEEEYITAQKVYTRGIKVFNDEQARTGLEGDRNTGKLFADMGDLEYFINGDMAAALENYQTAVATKYDTPSLNYRIGYINYKNKDFDKALAAFIKTSEENPSDSNLLLALGNTLSLRNDNFVAHGYYEDLLSKLNMERARRAVFDPQSDVNDTKLVEMYKDVSNNLGVTLYRLAKQTGNSSMNAEAIVRLSDSIRAWDILTRNPATVVRMDESQENLAARNIKYITHPIPDFEPGIFTNIDMTLENEKILE